jgi:hypothetical protein
MIKKYAILILVCLAVSNTLLSQNILDKEIKINQVRGTVREILNEIGNKGGFTFSYSNQIDSGKELTLEGGNYTVKLLLDKIFGEGKVDYLPGKNKIILKLHDKTSSRAGNFIMSGHVKDSVSGEVLIGATIYVQELSVGVTSNVYGFYSLNLPAGVHTMSISFVGYQTQLCEVNSDKDQVFNIQLKPATQQLEEVSVRADDEQGLNVTSPDIGNHKLSAAVISKIPALAGEVDVLRALQLLPGVKNSGEASANISVRGGGLDQNMILLDEAPVYNPSHVGGIFSVFNSDAIKDVQLYKGAIPTEYGGRLSSVLDVRMKDGNTKKLAVTGGIGTISSRLSIEGPIKKEAGSFLISGRYTYSDAITQSIKFMRENKFRFYFYDLNFKAHHTFNSKNKLFLSGYAGEDVNRLGILSDIKWNNATTTIRWNHIFNKNIFSNTTALYSRYSYQISAGYVSPFSWDSKIEDFSLKNDFTFFANQSNTLKFGFSSTHHEIDPGRATGGQTENENIKLPVSYSLEHALYVSNEQHLSDKWLAQYGLRYSLFQNRGKSTIYHYNSSHEITDTTYHLASGVYHTAGGLEPRLALRYKIDETSSLKASYNRTFQYLQLLSNSSFGLSPFDTWFPSGTNLKPQKADQISFGYFRNYTQHVLEVSVELYYKWLYHQVDFANHAQLLFNQNLEGELRTGKGYAYGAEFYLKKNTGKITGWLSYTYSRTKKLIPEISSKAFNANYDQPHSITAVANYNVSKRISISGNWVYATGRPTTLPIESYSYKDYSVPVYAERNSTRLQDYHRLDLSLTVLSKVKPGKRLSHNWVFSVYNVYARKNPLMVFTSAPFAGFKSSTGIDAYQISVLPFIPSLTYNFKF